MRFALFALAFTAAASGCDSKRSATTNAVPAAPNAAVAPQAAVTPSAAGPEHPPDMVEVEVELGEDEEEGLAGPDTRREGEAEASGEPMDDVDDGSDVSGAPEEASASDDPAVLHEQPARR